MTPLTKRTTIRLKHELYKRVEEESQKIGVSINAYISMVLSRELNKEKEVQNCQ